MKLSKMKVIGGVAATATLTLAAFFAPSAAMATEGEEAAPPATVETTTVETDQSTTDTTPPAAPSVEPVVEDTANDDASDTTDNTVADEGVVPPADSNPDLVVGPDQGTTPNEGGTGEDTSTDDTTDVSNPETPTAEPAEETEEPGESNSPIPMQGSVSDISCVAGVPTVTITVSSTLPENRPLPYVDVFYNGVYVYDEAPVNAEGNFTGTVSLVLGSNDINVAGGSSDVQGTWYITDRFFTVTEETCPAEEPEPETRVRTETQLSNTVIDCDAKPEENATDYFDQRFIQERKDPETGEWVFVSAGEWKFAYEETREATPEELIEAECEKPIDPVDPVDPVDPIDPVDPVDPVEPEPEQPVHPEPQPEEKPSIILVPTAPKHEIVTKVPAKALAATGSEYDSTAQAAFGGLSVLVIGMGALVVSAIRRRRQQSSN